MNPTTVNLLDWPFDATEPLKPMVPLRLIGRLLQLRIWQPEPHLWLVEEADFDQHGTGPTREAAVADLLQTLEEYFRMLLEHEGRLSPRLRGHLAALQDLMG